MRMALLGASGCGKSVTLKCIAGIMTPDRGHIILDGETLFDSEKHINLPPQKRWIGYLFQRYALFPNMTVLQNIRCGIRSGSRAEKRRRAEEKLLCHPATVGAARLTGNTNFLPAAACSGGVKLDGWNVVLPLEAETDTAIVVIPEGVIALGEGTHTALVDRVIRDLNGTVVLLRPADGADAPFLRVRVPENSAPEEGSKVSFSLLADKCLCYK